MKKFNSAKWIREHKEALLNESPLDRKGKMYRGFQPGDMWRNDFDYIGMLKYGAERGFYELGEETLQALYESFTDVNYHREAQDLGNALDWMQDPGQDVNAAQEKIEDFLAMFRKKCLSTLDVMGVKWQPDPSIERDMREGIHEVDYSTMRLKSNIDQKWDSTDTMMDDLRQYIGSAVAAGGPELGLDLAEALKLMMNFAKGEAQTAGR